MRTLFILLLLTSFCLLGCSNGGGGGGDNFFVNTQPLPNTNTVSPPPTPFVMVESSAGIVISDSEDLIVQPGVVHSFSIILNNVVGNGSLAASNVSSAASGTVSGLPLSISFSSLAQVGPSTFIANGLFSTSLCGPGTINVLVVYSEGATANLSTTLSFSIVGSVDCTPPADEICDNGIDDDMDGLTDCDDPDCTADPACDVTTPMSETITNHDGSAEFGVSFGSADFATAPKGFVVTFTSSLPTPFFITDITYTLLESTYVSTATIDAVAFSGVPSSPVELGRSTLPAGSAFSSAFVSTGGTEILGLTAAIDFTFSLDTPIMVDTSTFFAGIELTDPGNTAMAKDATTTTMDSWIYGGLTFFNNDDSLTPGHWLISVTVSTVP